jgi:hypothetical protein
VNLAHALHHLIQDTFHLHHHHHDDHTYSDNTHGHHHNALVDTMLEAIEEESDMHQPHTLIGIELFYHITRAVQIGDEYIYLQPNLNISYSSHLSTLCYIQPDSPPPKLANKRF